MKARYVQRGDAIDYTPMEDVAAGDVVVLSGKLVGVAKLDIKAGELGALALVGVYEFAKAEGIAFAAGMEVGWKHGGRVEPDQRRGRGCRRFRLRQDRPRHRPHGGDGQVRSRPSLPGPWLMIRTGIDALRSAQLDFLVSDATYRRGAEARSVKAVLGRTVFRSMNEYGAWVRTETRDFIIPAGQLDLEPHAGDEIVFDGGVYEVLAPYNEPVWRWSDPYRKAIRVHTKYTGDEA